MSGENAQGFLMVNGRSASGFYADNPNPNTPNVNQTRGYLNTLGTRYYTLYAVITGSTGTTGASATITLQASPSYGSSPSQPVTSSSAVWMNVPTALMTPFSIGPTSTNSMVSFTAPLAQLRVAVSFTADTGGTAVLNVWLQTEN